MSPWVSSSFCFEIFFPTILAQAPQVLIVACPKTFHHSSLSWVLADMFLHLTPCWGLQNHFCKLPFYWKYLSLVMFPDTDGLMEAPSHWKCQQSLKEMWTSIRNLFTYLFKFQTSMHWTLGVSSPSISALPFLTVHLALWPWAVSPPLLGPICTYDCMYLLIII